MRFTPRSFFCVKNIPITLKLWIINSDLKTYSTKQLNKEHLKTIFQKAKEMETILSWKKDGSNMLKGKIMASLFYEPSTRTRLSFETAMKRLGWEVITIASEWNTSLSK
jgi:aspartate carbamoyltransferase catalytic subunit